MTLQKLLKLSIITILGITLPLILTLILAWPGSQLLAQPPSPATPVPHEIRIDPRAKPLLAPGDDHPLTRSSALIDRTTVAVFESYQPLLTVTLVASDTYEGPLPTPFTYNLSGFTADQLQDLSFASEGGGSCTQQFNNNILCTGTINKLQVSFRTYYTPPVFAANVILDWGGTSTFDTDYTIDFFYPAPLEFVSTPITPVFQTGNHIRWTQADVRDFFGVAIFRDPRIEVVWLPTVTKS